MKGIILRGVKLMRIAAEIIGVLTTLFFASQFATIPWHDLVFWRMNNALAHYSGHLPDSQLIERKSFFGVRATDTSECAYAVGEFRSTTRSKEEVLAAYHEMHVLVLDPLWQMPIEVLIVEPDATTGLPLDNPADTWATLFARTQDMSDPQTTYYLTYLYNPKQFPWGDRRCDTDWGYLGPTNYYD